MNEDMKNIPLREPKNITSVIRFDAEMFKANPNNSILFVVRNDKENLVGERGDLTKMSMDELICFGVSLQEVINNVINPEILYRINYEDNVKQEVNNLLESTINYKNIEFSTTTVNEHKHKVTLDERKNGITNTVNNHKHIVIGKSIFHSNDHCHELIIKEIE